MREQVLRFAQDDKLNEGLAVQRITVNLCGFRTTPSGSRSELVAGAKSRSFASLRMTNSLRCRHISRRSPRSLAPERPATSAAATGRVRAERRLLFRSQYSPPNHPARTDTRRDRQ